MYMCNDGHHDIVYDTIKCPLCIMLEEVQTLRDNLQNLKDYAQELENKLDSAKID